MPTGQDNLIILQDQGKVREFCKMVRDIRKSLKEMMALSDYLIILIIYIHGRSRGGGGGGTGGLDPPPPHPLKNHKSIGFLSNTGLDLLKITQLPSKHSILGHHRYASGWRFAGGPVMVRF